MIFPCQKGGLSPSFTRCASLSLSCSLPILPTHPPSLPPCIPALIPPSLLEWVHVKEGQRKASEKQCGLRKSEKERKRLEGSRELCSHGIIWWYGSDEKGEGAISNSSSFSGGRCNPNRVCSLESVADSMVSLAICVVLLSCSFILRTVLAKIFSGDQTAIRIYSLAILGPSHQHCAISCSPLQERAANGLEISSIRGTHYHGKST